MHRCLHIEEIIDVILSHCDMQPTQVSLLNMALVCRAFYEPAMNVLWHTLETDIEPLVLLLPQCVLERDEDECLVRPISLFRKRHSLSS
jgi:hypothetical protein